MDEQDKLLAILEAQAEYMLKTIFEIKDQHDLNSSKLIFYSGASELFHAMSKLGEDIFHYTPTKINQLLLNKINEINEEIKKNEENRNKL